MDWQQALSLGIVAFTVALFARATVRKKNHPPASPCGSCTGCDAGAKTNNK